MSCRRTEFLDDAARDGMATNVMDVKQTGFAWGPVRDMEEWFVERPDLFVKRPHDHLGCDMGVA